MAPYRKKRKFVCPVCGKDFHKDSPLKKHMQDAHNSTKEAIQKAVLASA